MGYVIIKYFFFVKRKKSEGLYYSCHRIEHMTKNHDSLILNIGGISVLILSGNQKFIAQIKERYANFITHGQGPSLKIEVEVLLPQNLKINPSRTAVSPDVSFDNSKGRWTIKWHALFGEFDLRSGKGKLICPPGPSGLNSFLRFVYSLILLKEPGFLVHASSLKRSGREYIFPGKSDAGKTTITQLSPDATLLSDDISLIKMLNGGFIAFGTPFWGALAVGGENVSTTLTGIYFPIKDNKNYVQKLSPRQALEKLLPNVVFFASDSEFSKQLFNLCYDLVSNVPAQEFHFLPEPLFWRCIDAG
jgi:hypothetical protein